MGLTHLSENEDKATVEPTSKGGERRMKLKNDGWGGMRGLTLNTRD